MNVTTPRATPAALPHALSEAMRRAAKAEEDLDRVYPLFALRPDAGDESRAFAEKIRDAHRQALLALRSWSVRRGSHEEAAASYERLAGIIEQFAARAGLDAIDLDASELD